MLNNKITKIINDFGEILRKKKYPFKNIYLYGSYAKKQQTKYSDVDVAVIVNSPGAGKEYLNKKIKLWRLSTTADSRIEPILIGAKDLANGATTLALEVKKNGILII